MSQIYTIFATEFYNFKNSIMKANELRIGNYTKYENPHGDSHVVTVDIHDIEHCANLDPIPLTEEWLVKLGFRKYSSCQYDRDDFWSISEVLRGSRKGEYWCGQLECYVKHVHQLQNLYFALTGNELTI